jgi:hypothetical protein
MLGCEQKYVYRKVQKVGRDVDAPMDMLALDLGLVIHDCLELCKHDLSGFQASVLKTKMLERDVDEHWYPMLWAMLRRYKDLHEKANLPTRLVEVEIRSEDFLGFIDVVLGDERAWWIGDVKTAAQVNKFLPQMLPRDKQLNLYYAHFKPEEHGLDWCNFQGARYRVVTKSKLRRKKEDTDISYSKRMYEGIQAVEYVIPKEHMIPEASSLEFQKLRMRQKELWTLPQRARKNFANCVSYFRPCEYWSRCHGVEYSATPRVGVIEV